jgi:hypothetical protein
MTNPPIDSTAVRRFSQLRLLAVITCFALPILALTVIVPPWVKVVSQRRQILYWSQHVKVQKQTFAGYDFLFAEEKWHRTGPAIVPSDTYFDVEEYQVFAPLLVGEWVAILLVGVGIFIIVSRQTRRRLKMSLASSANNASWESQG